MQTTLLPVLLATLLAIPFAVGGCGLRSPTPEAFLLQRGMQAPAGTALTVCTGFGCATAARVELSAQDTARIASLFAPGASARQERARVALAVAELERLVGPRAGTAGDLARNRRGGAPRGQLDCLAETANTTVYLLLLENMGVLRHHEVAPPENRGATVFTAHNTAVLRQADGAEYAVDSWFFENGSPAAVVELDRWRAGWQPGEAAPARMSLAEPEEDGDGV